MTIEEKKVPFIGKGTNCNGYKVIDELGSGGMGITFEAIQTSLDRPVCLKIIQTDQAKNAQSVALFEKEAKSLARLSHPNVVSVFDFGEYKGIHYMVMELVAGETLDKYFAGREIDIKLSMMILRSVAAALSYVHQNNIIHRDVKPSNILVTPDGVVKLADFGVSRMLSHDLKSVETGGVGTSTFAAPEVLQGKRYDHRADIYSLGVVAFYLLVGRLPNQGEKPSQYNSELSEEVDDVLMKALSPRPTERYELVRTFINDLLNACDVQNPLETPFRESSTSNPRQRSDENKAPIVREELELMPTRIDQKDTSTSGLRNPSAENEKNLGPTVLNPQQITPRLSTNESQRETTESPILAPDSAAKPQVFQPSSAKKLPLQFGAGLLLACVLGAGVYMYVNRGVDANTLTSNGTPFTDPPKQKTSQPLNASALPQETPLAVSELVAKTSPTISTPSAINSQVFPNTGWVFDSSLQVVSRTYSMIQATNLGLWVATFNNSIGADNTTDVYLIDPKTLAERRVISLPCSTQQGISGLAVDEANDALFVSIDRGGSEESSVHRFTLNGLESTTFGSGGKASFSKRTLGCAVHANRLFVLINWGKLMELNPETGAELKTIELASGTYLRDIAITGNAIGAFGNGTFVEYDLLTTRVNGVVKLLDQSTPRATEGIGCNPMLKEFIVRPPETRDLISLTFDKRLNSSTESTYMSNHAVDFAISPDGTSLYATDLLKKEIMVFSRKSEKPVAPTTNTSSTQFKDVEGWTTLSDDEWSKALLANSEVVAICHYNKDSESGLFKSMLLDTPVISSRLKKIPCFSYLSNSPIPTSFSQKSIWKTAPELVFIDRNYKVLARFKSTATLEEIRETLDVLEIK